MMRDHDRQPELGCLLTSIGRLSDGDRRVVIRLVRHIARIEAEHGEDLALAVTQRMESLVCGRLAA